MYTVDNGNMLTFLRLENTFEVILIVKLKIVKYNVPETPGTTSFSFY